ncbi:MAG TPA: AMIN domain-containing protein [Candidatus Sulfotelmatobacter sp.]
MKLTTAFLATAVLAMAGAAWAQTPASSASPVLVAQQTAKPLPGAPAPAVKPAVIPDSKPAAPPAAKPAAKPAAQPDTDSDSGQPSELKSVKVSHNGDDIQIEISARGEITPRVSKLDSPARVLVELPETTSGTAQSHISVGKAGVKDVRVGMNGKTPPTTSVVVDLEKAVAYDLTQGPSNKLVLILHTQAEADNNPATAPVKTVAKPVKAGAPAVKTQTVAATAQAAPKSTEAPKMASAKPAAPAAKATVVAAAKAGPVVKPATASEMKDAKTATPDAFAKPAPAVEALKGSEPPKPEDKKWAMTGKRDPFFSPVVQSGGSGCSTGKKCLEIGQINLRGVVKSENGFIAVVTNTLNKAYFLRENDPVFNGYVVKITGDSVVFQETVQDKLGKAFTREVVKKIFTPAV